ncbi:hypothetical protein V6Z12_A08G284800 [Gossypium hirsutum]
MDNMSNQGQTPNRNPNSHPNPNQNDDQNQTEEQQPAEIEQQHHDEEEAEEEEDDEEEEEEEEEEGRKEDEELMAKAQALMEKITSSPDNPNPTVLHALASLLETQESLFRCLEENGPSSSNGRASHNVGQLGNLVRENDEFFDLISSKFLSESRYSTSVQAAAARLLLSCSVTWIYPHVFEEPVLENIKAWVMDETPRFSIEDHNCKHDLPRNEASDAEILKTYSTGLLAVCLAGGGQVVEDVLTSGLSAKLMRYLRVRVLGEITACQNDAFHLSESKSLSGAASFRSRDEGRGRVRQVLETTHMDDPRLIDEKPLDDHCPERDQERSTSRQSCGDECWVGDRQLSDGVGGGVYMHDVDADSEERWHIRDIRDGKLRYGEIDENGRDESSRRRINRGSARSKGKGRTSEGVMENEQSLTSPGSGSRSGLQQSMRDRNLSKHLDARKVLEAKKFVGKTNADNLVVEREDNDECFQGCKVGSKDFSDLVKKAVRAAEAEAMAANAPVEAIKAAGEAAAEVVKCAALEEFKTTNNEEAALLAASKAAATVVDAANAIEVSRDSTSTGSDPINKSAAETEGNEDVEEYFIPNVEVLAQLKERYCIQCLETLGEYVEVLGPVLHEKGVDVCLALLQRSSKIEEASKATSLLPDVMKLICALAAHRKFAALFVDRGGMQKLLAVPRVAQNCFGLSSCLFTIGSLQGIMERVCALPSDVVHQVVELAIQLLECPQDQVRKNAALFFAAAFVFRAVLDAFDAQDGLQKLLGLLNDAASVRSGANSGSLGLSGTTSFRNERSPSELQKDRKLGPAFVRTRWPAVEKFLGCNGHITMLELCQAPPVERYLHDLLQYALGVLHIVTLVPISRKMIVNATLSNNRAGIAVILDAANSASSLVDPEIIQPALNVLINLVCPPPSISNKPSLLAQGQQFASGQTTNAPAVETRNAERNILDRAVFLPNQSEMRERSGELNLVDRGTAAGTQSTSSIAQTSVSAAASGLVGDRRISLGAGAGCAGLAAQLEQGYRQAREVVRANNGIKVLLHLLQPRIYSPPAALDCLRALACRVLLGLARDETIAHILTKLQVGKKLSELIRDSGGLTPGTEQGRWQSELAQVAIELIAIVTNSGRASTLAATDAATPTLRRIERAAIAAATPITYHSRELLLLIHEHLQASGLAETAASLLKEAQLTPLPSLAAPSSLAHQASVQDTPSTQLQWPSGRTSGGFLSSRSKIAVRDEDINMKCDSTSSLKKKSLVFSPTFGLQPKNHFYSQDSQPPSVRKTLTSSKSSVSDTQTESMMKSNLDSELHCKTPLVLPMKRKLSELKDTGSTLSGKRFNTGDHGPRSPVCLTPNSTRRNCLLADAAALTPTSILRDQHVRATPSSLIDLSEDNLCGSSNVGQMTPSQVGLLNDPQPSNSERLSLDTIVVQYLKHQHRQCPAPITTLPPLSLLHPHVCPMPKRSLDAPSNITSRLGTREFRSVYGGVHGNRRDRQFVYSRFKPWRTCRDDAGSLLTCVCFLGDSSHIAVGSHAGELKIFDSNSNNVLDSCTGHQLPVTLVQSYFSGETQMVLSSSSQDVRLWDASSFSGGAMHSFEGCKAARFSNSGSIFAALSADSTLREILLYDIQTYQLELKLSDASANSTGRGHVYSLIHFSPSDTMLLWNGVLWDRRVPGPVHRFDQFTDYGGGGFHPAGNEVIINSEVWDLRKFRLLRSVPSLDQTAITFNARGDVIYAILRRNLEDVMSAVNTRRVKHPLFAAFRTLDAINYSDIATIPVDRCVLDFATEPTDSFVGLITMDDQEEMFSSARVYEIGRRRPTDDDSDPDDAESDEDEDDDDDDADVDPILGQDLNGDCESDADEMSSEDDSVSGLDDDDDDDGDFITDDADFDGGGGILEIVTEGEDDDDDSQLVESFSSGEEEDFVGNGFGF